MNREMVAEQCPAQWPALTASTHDYQYKKDANPEKAFPGALAGDLLSQMLHLLIHHRAR